MLGLLFSTLSIGVTTVVSYFVSLLCVIMVGSIFFKYADAVPLYFPPAPQAVGEGVGLPYIDFPNVGISPIYFWLVGITLWTISVIIASWTLLGTNSLYLLFNTLQLIMGVYLITLVVVVLKLLLCAIIYWLVGPDFIYLVYHTMWTAVSYYSYVVAQFIVNS